jgi:hypothetical protein
MVAQVDATLSDECRRGGAPFNDAHSGVVALVPAPLGRVRWQGGVVVACGTMVAGIGMPWQQDNHDQQWCL